MSLKEKIYYQAPVFFQNFMCTIYGYKVNKKRQGGKFHVYLKKFKENRRKGEEYMLEVQKQELKKFIKHTYENSEFYRQRFNQYQFNIEAENIYKELQKLPILSKKEVIENREEIKIKSVRKIVEGKTSGSTGVALEFCETEEALQKRWAMAWCYRNALGLELNTPHALFTGKKIIALEDNNPSCIWRENKALGQYIVSPYHLHLTHKVEDFYNRLNQKKITWFHGYPSMIAQLAYQIKKIGLPPLRHLKIITTSAENLLNSQKELLEEVFRVPVYNHYNMAEGVSNISQLPDFSYQIDHDYALTEFLPIEKSDQYRIIGTNYNNYAFPLIRYDVKDTASIQFMNNVPEVISLDGRIEDYVELVDGRKFGRMDYAFKNINHIKEAQIYQPSINHLEIRIVKGDNFENKGGTAFIEKEVRKFIQSNQIKITFKIMDEIPKTANKKLRFVISDIK